MVGFWGEKFGEKAPHDLAVRFGVCVEVANEVVGDLRDLYGLTVRAPPSRTNDKGGSMTTISLGVNCRLRGMGMIPR